MEKETLFSIKSIFGRVWTPNRNVPQHNTMFLSAHKSIIHRNYTGQLKKWKELTEGGFSNCGKKMLVGRRHDAYHSRCWIFKV